jgi:hypothetical protein
MLTCVWQRYDSQYFMQSKSGLNKKLKRKKMALSYYNQKENKIQIPYEYKVGDQVLLETPEILRKLSTPCTRPYPLTNVYKNGTIRTQKEKRNCIRKSEYPSIQSKAQLSKILGANDIP